LHHTLTRRLRNSGVHNTYVEVYQHQLAVSGAYSSRVALGLARYHPNLSFLKDGFLGVGTRSCAQTGAQRHAAASEPLYKQRLASGPACHAKARKKTPPRKRNHRKTVPRTYFCKPTEKQEIWVKSGRHKSNTRCVDTAGRQSVLVHLNICVAVSVVSGASVRVGGCNYTPCGSNRTCTQKSQGRIFVNTTNTFIDYMTALKQVIKTAKPARTYTVADAARATTQVLSSPAQNRYGVPLTSITTQLFLEQCTNPTHPNTQYLQIRITIRMANCIKGNQINKPPKR
jgi:hypothetical protein